VRFVDTPHCLLDVHVFGIGYVVRQVHSTHDDARQFVLPLIYPIENILVGTHLYQDQH
jgi:hypothetical protein